MPKLYIVPTPIGNLEDITLRSLRILEEVDLILAEDTRKTGVLLKHFDIQNKLKSHHQFNEHKSVEGIIYIISSGKSVALVSDAGTPAVSDPGYLLIRECLRNKIEVECLPGPTAFVPALVNSGIPTDHFIFEGFLPVKKGRKTRLEQLSHYSYTLVFYESPFRLIKTLKDFAQYFGEDRKASVSREISKVYEETVRGTIPEIIEHFNNTAIKGEIVIVVDGKK
jgi:16S rRNA (cytidine1402-2'-O)-methyltransferase